MEKYFAFFDSAIRAAERGITHNAAKESIRSDISLTASLTHSYPNDPVNFGTIFDANGKVVFTSLKIRMVGTGVSPEDELPDD